MTLVVNKNHPIYEKLDDIREYADKLGIKISNGSNGLLVWSKEPIVGKDGTEYHDFAVRDTENTDIGMDDLDIDYKLVVIE